MHPELRALLGADDDGGVHERAAALERALADVPPARGPEMLLERFVALGMTAGDVVLDLGCGHGQYALQIASATGARVVAADLVPARVLETAEATRSAGEQRLRVVQAAAEALPLRHRSLRAIWCRDMLNHVDLPRTLGECARVLAPGGWMLAYQTFATRLLEPREAERIYEAFEIVARNMDPAYFEACSADAGFSIVERDAVGGEWREWWEADGSRKTSDSLLRAARMLRAGGELRRSFGERAYEFVMADQLWGVYQMIGKLQPTVYVLRRS